MNFVFTTYLGYNIRVNAVQKLFGSPIRKIPVDYTKPEIFLTFDDGPDPLSTPHVLKLLGRFKAKATFFVIGTKVIKNKTLFDEILSEGHAVANHSYDHKYRMFFRGKKGMQNWISKSERCLNECGIHNTLGFRPPVGIRTPHMISTLEEMGIPLVLWSHRSFDTVKTFTKQRALQMLQTLTPGSIILLHDRQPMSRLPDFLSGTEILLSETDLRGWTKSPLLSKHITLASSLAAP